MDLSKLIFDFVSRINKLGKPANEVEKEKGFWFEKKKRGKKGVKVRDSVNTTTFLIGLHLDILGVYIDFQ